MHTPAHVRGSRDGRQQRAVPGLLVGHGGGAFACSVLGLGRSHQQLWHIVLLHCERAHVPNPRGQDAASGWPRRARARSLSVEDLEQLCCLGGGSIGCCVAPRLFAWGYLLGNQCAAACQANMSTMHAVQSSMMMANHHGTHNSSCTQHAPGSRARTNVLPRLQVANAATAVCDVVRCASRVACHSDGTHSSAGSTRSLR